MMTNMPFSCLDFFNTFMKIGTFVLNDKFEADGIVKGRTDFLLKTLLGPPYKHIADINGIMMISAFKLSKYLNVNFSVNS